MSDHDKNLFIEQHKDGYAILRGGVKEPLAVEPTQDAAIEKARKLDPESAASAGARPSRSVKSRRCRL
jgi:hypothetical protein